MERDEKTPRPDLRVAARREEEVVDRLRTEQNRTEYNERGRNGTGKAERRIDKQNRTEWNEDRTKQKWNTNRAEWSNRTEQNRMQGRVRTERTGKAEIQTDNTEQNRMEHEQNGAE